MDADVHGPSYRGAMGMSLVFLLVGLVVGALLGYVGAVAGRTSRPGDEAGDLRAEAARWQARAEELSRRVESAEARSQGDASVLHALAPVRAQLEQMTARVDQMEQTRARQHGALAEQLREAAQRNSIVEITLHSGRNRIVRRMLDAVGHPVTRLVRTRLGPLGIGGLGPGRMRRLSGGEIAALQREVGL